MYRVYRCIMMIDFKSRVSRVQYTAVKTCKVLHRRGVDLRRLKNVKSCLRFRWSDFC